MKRNSTTILLSLFFCISAFGQATTRIITDFGGYWSSTTASPSPVMPDTSHMLLGFMFNGVIYSTGVNDAVLTNNGVGFTPTDFRAFPVAGITGTYGSGSGGGISCFLALARKVDRFPNAANIPAIPDYTIQKALTDGVHGLDLGTGVTNLPTTAIMNFQIFSIDPTRIDDDEPDIILTQVAQPTSSLNDVFSLVDASGNQVGSTYVQDMTVLPSFGDYRLDLYSLTPNTPYNSATPYSIISTNINATRPIRVVALKLSVFGITAANAGQVAALKIAPSGISDYAFIAYNTNSIHLSPNISRNPPLTNTSICSGGTAHFSVVATAAEGGTLNYSWEESTDNGATWQPVVNGGNYEGAATDRLAVTNPGNGNQYRVTVIEAGNPNPVTSEVFEVTVIATPTAPSNVTITGGGTTCRGIPTQLTSTVTGGTNLFYQWESDPAGTNNFQPIPDANLSTYTPPVNQTGAVSYRLSVSSGSACIPSLTSPAEVITIDGISFVTAAERCGAGTVTLNASATSGTINWYAADAGGSTIATGTSYSPGLSSTTTFYVSTSTCTASPRVPVIATISPATMGGTLNGTTSVPPGSNSATMTLAGFTGTVVKWQSSTDGFVGNIVDIPVTANELTVTNISQTTQYRVQVQSGSCPAEFSTVATIILSTLPVHVGSLKATTQASGILIEWIAYNQQSTKQFEIERSTDGSGFVKVHTMISTGTNGDVEYEWLDIDPVPGRNYYRVKEVYISGTHEYSIVVNAVFENGKPLVSVYSNPVKERNLTLAFRNIVSGAYHVSYINYAGQVVHRETLIHDGSNHAYSLRVPASISPGLYRLVIRSNDKTIRVGSPVIIQ